MRGRSERTSTCATTMAWRTPGPSRMPASIELSIKLVVCKSLIDWKKSQKSFTRTMPGLLLPHILFSFDLRRYKNKIRYSEILQNSNKTFKTITVIVPKVNLYLQSNSRMDKLQSQQLRRLNCISENILHLMSLTFAI